jgi:hypothetical protein
MLHLDPLEPRTPRLPHPRFGALTQLGSSAALHVTLVAIRLISATSAPGIELATPSRSPISGSLTFGMSCFSRQRGRDRGAEGVAAVISKRLPFGAPRAWARTRSPCACESRQLHPPRCLRSRTFWPFRCHTDAKPLSSGIFDQIDRQRRRPVRCVHRSGSGAALEGIGTGIGSGRGRARPWSGGTGGGVRLGAQCPPV